MSSLSPEDFQLFQRSIYLVQAVRKYFCRSHRMPVPKSILRKLTFGATKNPLHQSPYNHLESAAKLPTISKCPSPKLVDDC